MAQTQDKPSGTAVFDQEIAPHLSRLVLACKKAGHPMFASVQLPGDQFHLVAMNASKSRGGKLLQMVWLNEASSLDEFLEKVIEASLRQGHDSTYLRAMGIPYEGLPNESGG